MSKRDFNTIDAAKIADYEGIKKKYVGPESDMKRNMNEWREKIE